MSLSCEHTKHIEFVGDFDESYGLIKKAIISPHFLELGHCANSQQSVSRWNRRNNLVWSILTKRPVDTELSGTKNLAKRIIVVVLLDFELVIRLNDLIKSVFHNCSDFDLGVFFVIGQRKWHVD
jgi:hypothetical protein